MSELKDPAAPCCTKRQALKSSTPPSTLKRVRGILKAGLIIPEIDQSDLRLVGEEKVEGRSGRK